MFSIKAQLWKRTPKNGTDRENFLTLLVDEFLNSSSYDAKCQVLANLANFAYDPINYDYIRDVGVLDIFLHVLKNDSDHKLLNYATAGICNLCLDPVNAEYIHKHAGLKPILALLHSVQTDILADTLATLIHIYNNETKSDINSPEVIQLVQTIKMSDDKRLVNLASIFLQDIIGIQ